MVATTHVWFLVGPNCGVDFLKNPLASETGVRGFSKPGKDFFFLMKTMGAVLPPTGLVLVFNFQNLEIYYYNSSIHNRAIAIHFLSAVTYSFNMFLKNFGQNCPHLLPPHTHSLSSAWEGAQGQAVARLLSSFLPSLSPSLPCSQLTTRAWRATAAGWRRGQR
jgi:hypothetical protein